MADATEGKGNANGVVGEGPKYVLSDDGAGAAAKRPEMAQGRKALAGKHKVGDLDG